MLHEFAIAPDAVATWDSFRLLVEHFGVPNGRLISRLPKQWEEAVLKECDAGAVERLRIVERLRNIKDRLTQKARPYNRGHSWLRNAEEQHIVQQFRAIINPLNPQNRNYVLLPVELNDDTPLWHVERELQVPRQGADMAACLEVLFQQSKEILFIDPHFSPARRFSETLGEFLRVAHTNNANFRRIEYHSLLDGATLAWFTTECNNWLPVQIPRGVSVKFVRWRLRPGGEDFHARYVLTDIGGLRFERGLDSGDLGQTTDVSLLSSAVYNNRYASFQTATPAFDYEDELTIVGTRIL